MDGAILKAFIKEKKLNRTKLAKDFGMSKQNLYQLFKTKTFEADTLNTIEGKFRVKWEKIKEQVNIDVPRATTRPQVPQKGQKSGAAHNGQKENYMAGEDLHNFSTAHRKVADTNATLATTNSELVSVIARVLPGNLLDRVLAPRVVEEFLREIFSGKKQMTFDELTKELRKALTQDNGYK